MTTANSRRVLATIGVVGVVGALAATGTYSAFTGSTQTTQNISSGTLTLTAGSNTLTVPATDIAPGDTIQRTLTLTPGGTVGTSAINVATTATTSSLLDTDTTNGLQMRIEKCDSAWVAAGATFTCASGQADVLGAPTTKPVVQTTPLALTGVSLTGANYLRVTLSLPTSADNSFQNQSSAIEYTFTSAQRAGTDK